MGQHPDISWTVPDGDKIFEWQAGLRVLPSSITGLKRLQPSLSAICVGLASLNPVTDEDEDGEDSLANPSQQDDPMEPTEPEPLGRAVPIHSVDEAMDTQDEVEPTVVDQNQGREKIPSPEPEMKLVDDVRKDLAGQEVLANRGLVDQDPKVSAFISSSLVI